MKKTRKYLAFILALGLMMSSMTVFAAEPASESTSEEESWYSNLYYYSGGIVDTTSKTTWVYYGEKPSLNAGDGFIKGDLWYDIKDGTIRKYNGSEWVNEKEYQAIKERALAEALQAEAEDAGFADVAQMQYAEAARKDAGEYYNNAVVTTPGIEEAIPVAQGGGLIIDGEVTKAVASISKVTVAYVDSVRAAQEGRVLNVVDVRFPSLEATINFYMPGVVDGADIVALQYVDGAWINVDVVEVRADHVVLNMKGNGVVAFVAK